MEIVSNNSNPPVTLTHVKGNDFSAEFTFSGTNVISNPIGRVTRVDDNENLVLLEFSPSDSSSTVNGTLILLTKPDASILIPRGTYAFELEVTIGGDRDKYIKNSFFVVE